MAKDILEESRPRFSGFQISARSRSLDARASIKSETRNNLIHRDETNISKESFLRKTPKREPAWSTPLVPLHSGPKSRLDDRQYRPFPTSNASHLHLSLPLSPPHKPLCDVWCSFLSLFFSLLTSRFSIFHIYPLEPSASILLYALSRLPPPLSYQALLFPTCPFPLPRFQISKGYTNDPRLFPFPRSLFINSVHLRHFIFHCLEIRYPFFESTR